VFEVVNAPDWEIAQVIGELRRLGFWKQGSYWYYPWGSPVGTNLHVAAREVISTLNARGYWRDEGGFWHYPGGSRIPKNESGDVFQKVFGASTPYSVPRRTSYTSTRTYRRIRNKPRSQWFVILCRVGILVLFAVVVIAAIGGTLYVLHPPAKYQHEMTETVIAAAVVFGLCLIPTLIAVVLEVKATRSDRRLSTRGGATA
jgi:hypothetical protein